MIIKFTQDYYAEHITIKKLLSEEKYTEWMDLEDTEPSKVYDNREYLRSLNPLKKVYGLIPKGYSVRRLNDSLESTLADRVVSP